MQWENSLNRNSEVERECKGLSDSRRAAWAAWADRCWQWAAVLELIALNPWGSRMVIPMIPRAEENQWIGHPSRGVISVNDHPRGMPAISRGLSEERATPPESRPGRGRSVTRAPFGSIPLSPEATDRRLSRAPPPRWFIFITASLS